MKKILTITAASLILVSCEKELDFHYHEVESQLVIEGNTTEAGTTVRLTRTCPMDLPLDLTPVTDAQVILSDLTDGSRRKLEINEMGIYEDAVPGSPGHEYRLEVTHGSKKYESECTMRQPTEILGLGFQWIKMPYDHVAVLQITFRDLQSHDDCYWIRIFRNDEPYEWMLSDESGATDGIIRNVTMTSRMDVDEEDERKVLKDGDVVKVVVSPIARNMYDYLVGIQADSNGPRMFSGDFCLGYYLATSPAESSVIFHPDSISYYHKPGNPL